MARDRKKTVKGSRMSRAPEIRVHPASWTEGHELAGPGLAKRSLKGRGAEAGPNGGIPNARLRSLDVSYTTRISCKGRGQEIKVSQRVTYGVQSLWKIYLSSVL